jgi:acyl-CoA thioester hydrolase
MEKFILPIQIRWSDLDPNFHLRHSVYYDWAAMCRIEFLNNHGLTSELMIKHQFGPILFREECLFKKEVKMNDQVTIDLVLLKSRKDFSRWYIQHTISKNDETLCAIVTVDGAWLDTVKRKLTVPPEEVAVIFREMPIAREFEWTN